MAAPAVTLVLPIFNMERFLEASLRSILAQTFADFEVIAILDACTDGSEEILNKWKDERFTVIRNAQNLGVGATTDLGLQRARGEFFARMDADDVMDPRRLERQVEFLRSHPEIDIVGTWFDYIDEHGHLLQSAYPFPTTHEDIKDGFRVRTSVGGPTAMYRAERLRAVGGFSPQHNFAEDLRIMLTCLAAGYCFANLPEVLYHYRQHRVQLNKRRRRETLQLTDLAYREFGPRIWGKDAPDFNLGKPIVIRAIKKMNRTLRRLFAARP